MNNTRGGRPRGRPRKPLPGPDPGPAREVLSHGGPQATSPPWSPRLLDLAGAAAYLSVSEWTVRDLEHGGIVRRVRIPLPHDAELRKLLFDRADLDTLIASWKAQSTD